MNTSHLRRTNFKNVWAALVGLMAFGLMSACGVPTQTTPIPELTVPAVTAIPSPSSTAIGFPPVPDDPTKQAAATLVAVNDDIIRTRVALTHEPTETHGRPPVEVTWTPVMGIMPGCSRYPSKDRRPVPSCWRGVLNGEIVEVWASVEGPFPDLSQGVLEVTVWDHDTEIYRTPQGVGPVRIVSVEGTLFTLAPVDLRTPGVMRTPFPTGTPETILLFDLATRQWVSPTGSPTVSVSVVPPTLTIPLPTVTVPEVTVTIPPLPSPTVGLP